MNSKPSRFCSTLHPPTFALHFQVSLKLLGKNKANLCWFFITALTLGFLSFFIRCHKCFSDIQAQSYPPAWLSASSPCQQSNSQWNVGKVKPVWYVPMDSTPRLSSQVLLLKQVCAPAPPVLLLWGWDLLCIHGNPPPVTREGSNPWDFTVTHKAGNSSFQTWKIHV